MGPGRARARFVAFEGGEGCGKSTQAARLASAIGAVLTREPGGTPLGARLRGVVLDEPTLAISARAEALVLAADRAQHIATVVVPTLAGGRHVVSDRSALSFLAYQGHGRGLDLGALRGLSDWASDSVWPDLVFLLDVPVAAAAARRAAAGLADDRVEAEGVDFHERVRSGFLAMAEADPDRWAVVDGAGEPDDVAALVWGAWEAAVQRWEGAG